MASDQGAAQQMHYSWRADSSTPRWRVSMGSCQCYCLTGAERLTGSLMVYYAPYVNLGAPHPWSIWLRQHTLRVSSLPKTGKPSPLSGRKMQ
eukprot:4409943-Pyramimonas_sp.AAC.1